MKWKIKLPENYIMNDEMSDTVLEKEQPMTRQEAIDKLVKLNLNGRDKLNARNLLEALEALGLIKFAEEKKEKSLEEIVCGVMLSITTPNNHMGAMQTVGGEWYTTGYLNKYNYGLLLETLDKNGYVIERKNDSPAPVPKGFYSEAEIRQALSNRQPWAIDEVINNLKKKGA